MFRKLLAAICSLGLIACGLLSARQQRLQTARDTIRLHDRLAELRQTQWALDLEIAARMRPESLHDALAALGDEWTPLVGEPVAEAPLALAGR